MSTPSRPVILDELFGAAPTSSSSPPSTTPSTTVTLATTAAATLDTPLWSSPSPPIHRDVSPPPSQSLVRLLDGGHPHPRPYAAGSSVSLAESASDATPPCRGTHRSTAEYSALSSAVSRAQTHASFTSPTASVTSWTSGADARTSSVTPGAHPGGSLPVSPSPWSALAEQVADDPASTASPQSSCGGGDPYCTYALLQRFLSERRRIEKEHQLPGSTMGGSAARTNASLHRDTHVLGELRSAQLVPSVVPAVAAAAEVSDGQRSSVAGSHIRPFRVESAFMRAATVTAVLRRQKAERHDAFEATHSLFRAHTPLADTGAVASSGTAKGTHTTRRLPAVLDMPLPLRCAMCQKHDALCSRCHRRWSVLQERYREEIAGQCYSALDSHHRRPLALLTAAVGTGAFLEMMAAADGLALTQTRLRVTQGQLKSVLESCGRAPSPAAEARLAMAEDAALPSRPMLLTVAHVACLSAQPDVLRCLWRRCAGGCSYAAQIAANGVHALELLPEPLNAATVALMNQSTALREYLLWARVMQCLAVKAADDAEAPRLCAALRDTGSWVGVWAEALLAYVSGRKERCAELCDELLACPAAHKAPGDAVGGAATHEAGGSRPVASLASVTSLTSEAVATTTALTSTASRAGVPSSAAAKDAMRPVLQRAKVEALKALALTPEAALPRLEATEEKEAFTPVQEVAADGGSTARSASTQRADTTRCVGVRVRRLPFSLVRRIVSFCDATTLLSVHEASYLPLLQWVALARIKCLSPAQWTRLLTGNEGHAALRQMLCAFTPPPLPPTPSREKQEAGESTSTGHGEAVSGSSAVPSAVSFVAPPFEPLHIAVVDVEDLSRFVVKASTLAQKAVLEDAAANASLRVGQEVALSSLFGKAAALVRESTSLVLSRTCRVYTSVEGLNVANSDVSEWNWKVVQPWEVDVPATVRWCNYIRQQGQRVGTDA